MNTIVSFAVGIIGCFLNLIVAVIIILDKEMSNPTFKFMVHLAIADVEVLASTLIAPSLMSMLGFKGELFSRKTAIFFSFVLCAGYVTVNCFLVLVAFSRWVHFAKPHLREVLFTKTRLRIIILLVYLVVHAVYVVILFDNSAITLIGDDESSFCVYNYANNSYALFLLVFNGLTEHGSLLTQAAFNAMSLYWIWDLRNKIESPELRKRHGQEVKLFVLCVVDGLIAALLVIIYDLMDYAVVGDWIFVFGNVVATLNHVDCAVIYLCINKRLRSGLVNFFKKIFSSQNGVVVVPMVAYFKKRSNEATRTVPGIGNVTLPIAEFEK